MTAWIYGHHELKEEYFISTVKPVYEFISPFFVAARTSITHDMLPTLVENSHSHRRCKLRQA
jgi:hypothetical protein